MLINVSKQHKLTFSDFKVNEIIVLAISQHVEFALNEKVQVGNDQEKAIRKKFPLQKLRRKKQIDN